MEWEDKILLKASEVLPCPFCDVRGQKGMSSNTIWCINPECDLNRHQISIDTWQSRKISQDNIEDSKTAPNSQSKPLFCNTKCKSFDGAVKCARCIRDQSPKYDYLEV